jgi:iron complex outermembrane receptor protein
MHLFHKYISSIFFILLLTSSTPLHAENVEELLNEYTRKNDTSLKTIDENKGHLILFTREKIEHMHANTLKDILKTTPVLYYHENRYAIPDPLASASPSPYASNLVKIYIDGVEITQGWMGSGLALYGDIDIDFVDHIEFYYMAPSFETSAEPAFMTIFLYSKDPSNDSDATLNLMHGDNGYNAQSFNFGKEKENYSYMVNISHTDAKRNTIDNSTNTPLSRDYKRTQLFGYFKNESQVLHLQILQKKSDSLASLSWDATPEQSEVDYFNLHLDYGIDINTHWYGRLSYDHLNTDIRFKDDHKVISYNNYYPFNTFTADASFDTYTAELTYKNIFGNHHLITGIKDRLKLLSNYKINELPSYENSFDREHISTLFFQDQYKFTDKHLFSLGLGYNHVSRNDTAIPDEDLFQFRLGYIYVDTCWSYKSYLYHNTFTNNSLELSLENNGDFNSQKSLGFTQELQYTDKNQSISFMLLLMRDENGAISNNSDEETKYFYGLFNYHYNFNAYTKLDFQLYYAKYINIFDLDELEDWSSHLALSNTYNDLEFSNSIVWHKNSIDYKNFFDWTSAMSWSATKNTSFTLKGQNLLNNAKKSTIFRTDPNTMSPISPLKIPISDRRITLEVEYIF